MVEALEQGVAEQGVVEQGVMALPQLLVALAMAYHPLILTCPQVHLLNRGVRDQTTELRI